jgi:hypothetical protein
MPVEITTWAELHAVRDGLSGEYELMNNLGPSDTGYDTYASSSANSGAGWEPIASFTGSLDGDGYAIIGLFIDRSGAVGLFTGLTGTVTHLSILDADVSGTSYAAVMASGLDSGANISECWVSGAALSTGSYVGGICGYFGNGATISECRSDTNVSGVNFVGSLTGDIEGGQVYDSYATGNATASGEYCGAFTGVITFSDSARCERCYATGDVAGGSSRSGGFVGGHVRQTATCKDNFSTGDVSGSGNIGGFTGLVANNAACVNCYWLDTAGNPSAGIGATLDGGSSAGVTAVEDVADLYDYENEPYSTWDFDTVWSDSNEGVGLPRLQWEPSDAPSSNPRRRTAFFALVGQQF